MHDCWFLTYLSFPLCIRTVALIHFPFNTEHYKDALMYSEMILSKAPDNALVAQFQPLLAHLAVQVELRGPGVRHKLLTAAVPPHPNPERPAGQ
jgi:hypothetical protein